MRNKGKFSKWLWLVLVVAFAAIAGGGCNGSSSNGGGDGGDESGNVQEVTRSTHPLAEHLRELYHQMPEGTHILSENITREQLGSVLPKLRDALESGKIIGMYAPTQAKIKQLRRMLGVRTFQDQVTSDAFAVSAAAEEDEAPLEFYMITKRGDSIFQHRWRYVDENTPGFTIFEEKLVKEIPSSDWDIVPGTVIPADPPLSSDAEIAKMQRARTKDERYPGIAASIARWHDEVNAIAATQMAKRSAARDVIRAASGSPQLEELVGAHHDGTTYDIVDLKEDGYKVPTIDIKLEIYSCYSYNDNKYYYLINSHCSMNNSEPVELYRHWYGFDWGPRDNVQNFMNNFRVWSTMTKNGKDGIGELKKHTPPNTNHEVETSYSFGMDLSGNVGVDSSGPSGGISAGISIGESKSYTTQDYEAINHCTTTNVEFEWSFEEPRPYIDALHHAIQVSWTPLQDASNAARYNFTSDESWIWSIARSEIDGVRIKYGHSYVAPWMKGTTYLHNAQLYTKSYSMVYDYFDLPLPPTVVFDTNKLSVNANGRMAGDKPVTFHMLTDGAWKAEVDADWVTLDTTSSDEATGDSQLEILVQIAKNPNPDVRKAEIKVTSDTGAEGTLAISQEGSGAAWTISVDPDSINADVKGGQYKFNVRSDTDWTASCSASWVHLSATSGNATGSTSREVTVTVDATSDSSPSRTAEIVVRGADGQYRTISVTQKKLVLEVDRTSLEYGYYSGPQSFSVRANVDWTVSTDADWIQPDKTRGSATGDTPQAVKVYVAQNLGPARSGKIVVSDAAGQTKTVNVSQAAPELKVSPASIKPDWKGGQFKISLTSRGSWTASVSWGDWCHLSETSGAGSSSPKDITLYVDQNDHGGRGNDIIILDEYGQQVTVHINQGIK